MFPTTRVGAPRLGGAPALRERAAAGDAESYRGVAVSGGGLRPFHVKRRCHLRRHNPLSSNSTYSHGEEPLRIGLSARLFIRRCAGACSARICAFDCDADAVSESSCVSRETRTRSFPTMRVSAAGLGGGPYVYANVLRPRMPSRMADGRSLRWRRPPFHVKRSCLCTATTFGSRLLSPAWRSHSGPDRRNGLQPNVCQ